MRSASVRPTSAAFLALAAAHRRRFEHAEQAGAQVVHAVADVVAGVDIVNDGFQVLAQPQARFAEAAHGGKGVPVGTDALGYGTLPGVRRHDGLRIDRVIQQRDEMSGQGRVALVLAPPARRRGPGPLLGIGGTLASRMQPIDDALDGLLLARDLFISGERLETGLEDVTVRIEVTKLAKHASAEGIDRADHGIGQLGLAGPPEIAVRRAGPLLKRLAQTILQLSPPPCA